MLGEPFLPPAGPIGTGSVTQRAHHLCIEEGGTQGILSSPAGSGRLSWDLCVLQWGCCRVLIQAGGGLGSTQYPRLHWPLWAMGCSELVAPRGCAEGPVFSPFLISKGRAGRGTKAPTFHSVPTCLPGAESPRKSAGPGSDVTLRTSGYTGMMFIASFLTKEQI